MDIAISTGLDLIIVIIFVAFISTGINRGLIRSVIGLLGKTVSVIIAFIFSENLGVYIDKTYVHSPLRQWLINELSPTADNVTASLSDLDLESLFVDLPDFFTEIADFLGFDTDLLHTQYETIAQQSVEQAKAAVIDVMISPLSAIVSRVIAFAFIFAVCCIAVSVLWWLSDLIVNVPIIRQLDKIGGLVFGVLNSFLMVFVVVAVINIGSNYFMKDRTLESRRKITENTLIFKHFNEYNPLNSLFISWE